MFAGGRVFIGWLGPKLPSLALLCCTQCTPVPTPIVEDDPVDDGTTPDSGSAAATSGVSTLTNGVATGSGGMPSNAGAAATAADGGRPVNVTAGSSGGVAGASGVAAPGVPNAVAGASGGGVDPMSSMGAGAAGVPSTPEGPQGCAAGELSCAGRCVRNDNRNCGACDHDCSVLPHVVGQTTCVSGVCQFDVAACSQGWAHCGTDPESGCETAITEPTNCGACGNTCPPNAPMCSNGMCVSGCPASAATLCGQTCADTQSNAQHCGACGNRCTASPARGEPECKNGTCGFRCVAGSTACGSSCVDTQSDKQHCGGCNQACSGSMMCVGGRCTCPFGTHDCGGRCAPDDSVTECGSSCQVCRSGVAGATDTCVSGRCSFRCQTGYTECRTGTCTNTSTDGANCGGCGRACGAGATCTRGTCTCPSGQNYCNGGCVESSVTACGSSCRECPFNPPFEYPICNGGVCTKGCSGAFMLCGNSCLDTSSDPSNCGACGRRCTAACVGGVCE